MVNVYNPDKEEKVTGSILGRLVVVAALTVGIGVAAGTSSAAAATPSRPSRPDSTSCVHVVDFGAAHVRYKLDWWW